MALLNNLYNPDAEAQNDPGKLPTGEYVAQIIDSDLKPTSGNDGQYLELTYEVTEGSLKGRKHWERLNLDNPNQQTVEIANRAFASIREATGVPNPRDSTELHFRPHIIRVEHFEAGSIYTYGRKKGQPRERDESQIRAWKKLEGAPTSAAPAAPAQTSGAPVPPWQRNAA